MMVAETINRSQLASLACTNLKVSMAAMVSGQWSVVRVRVSGQWSVVSGQWSVVSGQWSVVSGQW